MKRIFLIIICYLFFSFPPQIFSKESGILYLWEISDRRTWKKFGDDKTHQKYNGEIKYSNPHGLGIKIFLDGRKYMGEWKNGERHGQGTLIFSDGVKFEGEWKGDKPWNIKRIDKRNRVYDEYINGEKQISNRTEGVLFFQNQKDNFGWHKTGKGEKDYKYIGEIENGKPNGWGKFTYPSGYIIEGQFKDGKVHGKGSFSFTNGKKGIGQFRKGKPWNVKEFDNESKIIGIYVDGVYKTQQKSTGVLFTRKENQSWVWFESEEKPYIGKYEGQIDNGIPEGYGTLTLLNGTKYIGEFKNGAWNGKGTFFFRGGDKWQGEFKNDSPWNIRWLDKKGKLIAKWQNGIKILFKN